MGDAPASEMQWNEPFFRDCFDNVDKVVTWVSRKGNPFVRHQTIAQDFIAEKKIDCYAQECGDQVCVAGFNDGKGPASEEGVQDSCQGCTFPRVACIAA